MNGLLYAQDYIETHPITVSKEADDTYSVSYKGFNFIAVRHPEADLAYLTHDSERPHLNQHEETVLLSLMDDCDEAEINGFI